MKSIIKTVNYALLFGVILLAPYLAFAVDVPPADYSGSRSLGNGVVQTGGLLLLNYNIDWNIANNNNGTFHYSYSTSNILGLSVLQSSLFIQLGAGYSLANISNFMINGNLLSALLGYSVVDAVVGGDSGILITPAIGTAPLNNIAFDINAAPIWGDFAQSSTAGLLGAVQNTGFGTPATAGSNFTNYIAVPGAAIPVPEPATLLTLSTGLAIAAAYRKRRQAA